ncbi:MAG: hypothetical protein ACM3QZ_01260 [Solirubrobacterales bacterium]
MRKATCRTAGVYSEALVRGNTYEILDEDQEKGQVKVKGENGRTRWFSAGCFDFECKPVPALVDWTFDDHVSEDDDGTDPNWIEVSFDLSDGSRRWCILYTPERLLSSLGRPDLDPPGLHIPHMIIVRSYRREDVERTLRYLDEEDRLIGASRELNSQPPLNDDEEEFAFRDQPR